MASMSLTFFEITVEGFLYGISPGRGIANVTIFFFVYIIGQYNLNHHCMVSVIYYHTGQRVSSKQAP